MHHGERLIINPRFSRGASSRAIEGGFSNGSASGVICHDCNRAGHKPEWTFVNPLMSSVLNIERLATLLFCL